MPSLHDCFQTGKRLFVKIIKIYCNMFFIKNFKSSPFIYITVSFILGLFLGGTDISIILPLFIAVIGIGLLFIKGDIFFVSGILFCTASFGWQMMFNEISHMDTKRSTANQLHETTISFSSEVKEIQSTEKGFKYKISLNEYHDIDVWFFNKKQLFCEIGDTISTVGEFQEIRAVRNPGEFNFLNYYNRQNIYGWIFADDHYVIRIDQNEAFQLNKIIVEVRDKIRDFFKEYAPGVAGDLLSALILGDKSDVEPSIRDSFAETGVIHVLAVSGLHVGYVLIILLLLKNMLGLPWGWDRIVVILGLCIFVLITGSKASVVRASIMAGLYILAPVVNRQVNIWNIIAVAGFIILCFNPLDLFDLGFQLSFLAVISIVFFYNWLNETLPEKIRVNNIQNTIIRFVWGLFLVSFSAQIGTLPLTSFVFGKIPVVALIANVFIVPLIGLLVGIGFAILFLNWIPGIGYALGNTAWLIAKIITTMTYSFSGLKYSSFQLTFSPFHILLYLLIILSIVLLCNSQRRKFGLLSLLLVSNLLIWKWVINEKKMDIIFMDVGQGDAALIIFPNDKTMLIDAGQRNQYEDMGTEVVMPVLKYLNIEKLDWVVMSHPHSDHIGGLVNLINEVKIDTLLDSFIPYKSWTYKTIIRGADKNEVYVSHPHQGEVMKLSDNVIIEFLAPDSVFAVSEHNVNNASIVFKLSYGATSVLFTGDLEYEGDQFLLPYENMLNVNVLKVAHHGSITSTTTSLLDFIQPDIAVVSVGRKNKFKHPSSIVMERLEERNIDIHRTDTDGALWLRSDGETFTEVLWK